MPVVVDVRRLIEAENACGCLTKRQVRTASDAVLSPSVSGSGFLAAGGEKDRRCCA
jgi:hypothetical protein